MKSVRFVGLDVHADTIPVAVAAPGGEVRSLGTIPNRPELALLSTGISSWASPRSGDWLDTFSVPSASCTFTVTSTPLRLQGSWSP